MKIRGNPISGDPIFFPFKKRQQGQFCDRLYNTLVLSFIRDFFPSQSSGLEGNVIRCKVKCCSGEHCIQGYTFV